MSKKINKKILSLLLAVVLMLTPVVCFGEETETAPSAEASSSEVASEETTKKETTTQKETTTKEATSSEATTEEETTEEVIEEGNAYYQSEEYRKIANSSGDTGVVVNNISEQESVQNEIDAINITIQKREDNVAEISQKIRQTKERREKLAYEYGQFMRAMYIAGEGSKLEILLEAHSIEDYFTRMEMIKSVTKKCDETFQNLKKEQQKLEKEERELAKEQADIEVQKALLEDGLKTLKALNGMSTGSGTLLTADDVLARAAAGESFIVTDGFFSYPTKYRNISGGFPNYSSGRYHGALDFPCPMNTPVHAAADGVVVSARSHYSYGNYVMIDHGNGLATLYAHNTSLAVSVGDVVKRGQIIALSGSTGNSTGPHVHFEVRVNGERVNPKPYLEGSGVETEKKENEGGLGEVGGV